MFVITWRSEFLNDDLQNLCKFSALADSLVYFAYIYILMHMIFVSESLSLVEFAVVPTVSDL